MPTTTPLSKRPPLVIGQSDHQVLTTLALNQNPSDSDNLLYELELAAVVSDDAVPPDAVRMGSRVHYETSKGDRRWVTLVYPAEADIAAGRISVLTPVGTALIGMRPGLSIAWSARDGRRHELKVLAVDNSDR